MSGRLDDEKLETLRRWGAGLTGDDRDELRAAGKAILILVDEIERLQVDVWHADRSARVEPEADTSGDDGVPQELEPTLRGRVGRLLRGRAANDL